MNLIVRMSLLISGLMMLSSAASAQQVQSRTYRAYHIEFGQYFSTLPKCDLKVTIIDGGETASFRAGSFSRRLFRGYFPQTAGTIELFAVNNVNGQTADEALIIDFEERGGEIHPVGYRFRDFRAQRSNRLIQEKSCLGLRLID